MREPWLSICEKLQLSKKDRAILAKYKKNPKGKSFLSLGKILISNGYEEEAIELLLQGVDRHPQYIAARVVLAERLMKRGMLQDSWSLLEAVKSYLLENVLAQKLRFQIAIVLDKEFEARDIYSHMRNRELIDSETKKIGEELEYTSFAKVRKRLTTYLENKGMDLSLIRYDRKHSSDDCIKKSDNNTSNDEVDLETEITCRSEVDSFHVVPLNEVFKKNSDKDSLLLADKNVELDSTTLAEVYKEQGNYKKAIEIYRRMFRITPGNEFLKRKIRELVKLRRDQREHDLSIDPEIVDQMEMVEVIDVQLAFLNRLLSRLD